MSLKGRARVYCAGRADGLGCTCRGTFLDVYEQQIRWYLEHFVIPEDYQERLIGAHKALRGAYDADATQRKASLQVRLKRLQEMYEWGHKARDEYLKDYDAIQRELASARPEEERGRELERLADFLQNVAEAWDVASQEHRNKLARTLFDEIWVEDTKVVAVKPRPELAPFFDLNLECHTRDIAGDPDRIRTGDLCLDRLPTRTLHLSDFVAA